MQYRLIDPHRLAFIKPGGLTQPLPVVVTTGPGRRKHHAHIPKITVRHHMPLVYLNLPASGPCAEKKPIRPVYAYLDIAMFFTGRLAPFRF